MAVDLAVAARVELAGAQAVVRAVQVVAAPSGVVARVGLELARSAAVAVALGPKALKHARTAFAKSNARLSACTVNWKSCAGSRPPKLPNWTRTCRLTLRAKPFHPGHTPL